MATRAASSAELQTRKMWGYKPGPMDYVLSIGCFLMLGAMILAVWRGREQVASVPFTYPIHFITLGVVLTLTPILLLRAKGDRLHRVLGYVWIGSMVTTAIDSFFIRDINDGGFSPIHLLSILTLFVSWRIVASARKGDHAAHRKHVHGIVIGALLIAGSFTFMFGRLFDIWLDLGA
ncbi:DUF2306 domain-containing protein [Altererythrobacter sp. SALINAS58]|uniref:DUF2306 domain-containing protein n=1 Tax=Alteripontixanthobacter muriae TaxID=2705546 RepID=UPI00157713F4|nr:DUF2306 domain-containing protein [Alteripontixanthobacter muriae]NTZ43365.1 DUF2306 domain-containing protein [Alteripontixanthobacter muriae]